MADFFKRLFELILSLFKKKDGGETDIEEPDTGATDTGVTIIDTGTTINIEEESGETIEIIKHMVELKLVRIFWGDTYTIGKLYVNNEYFCDTLEDKDRGLTSDMNVNHIFDVKIKDRTAIPYGKYEVTMSIQSPKYSDFSKYSWSKKYNAFIPRILEVPGFSGILMHPGNTDEDTSGCILVGKNTQKGMITSSQKTFFKLMDEVLIPHSDGGITIEITK